MSLRSVTVVATRMLTPSVRELTLDPGPGFTYVPGQWVSLRIPLAHGEFVQRAYSIASPPREDGRFAIAVTRVEGGPGSNALHTIAPRQTLECSHAQGFFTLEPAARSTLLVATGTGVCPLRALLGPALAPDRAPARVTLLLGVRTEDDLLYRDDFERLQREHPARFRFVPTLSRPGDAWTGRTGYVQTHLRALFTDLGGDADVYVCGLQRMVREARAVLKGELGLPRERIHAERYD
jgi:CDP-4-dehydro-6-deoxyglucose reductase